MSLGHRILVPLDGSDFAEQALPLARVLAEHADGVLDLVSVHVPWPPTDLTPDTFAHMDEFSRAAGRALDDYLMRTATDLKDQGFAVRPSIRVGRPESALLDHCREEACDLIVMATHGRGGFDRLWLGSVADRVVRHAGVPVLLVSAHGGQEIEQPEWTADVRTVIIALDGSPLSESALAPATALGEAFGADYILFRAVPPAGSPMLPPPYPAGAWMVEQHELGRAEARRALADAAAGMREAGFDVTEVVEDESEPARALLRLAAATPGSVIALATHGRGGLRRRLLGSVTDKVVRASPRPVLAVRPIAASLRDTRAPGAMRRSARTAEAASARAMAPITTAPR